MASTVSMPKPVVKISDMSEDMLNFALFETNKAFMAFNNDKEVAQAVRNAFVTNYHGVWHCFVGRNFGSFGTYEQGHYVYFYLGQHAVMLFKTN